MDLHSQIIEFLKIYFFSGYTLFNTIIYSLILALIIIGLIKFFKKLEKDPTELIFYVIPFIFIGSCIRALVDNRILFYNWFLITPGIYFIVGSVTILSLLIGIYLEKKMNIDYRKILFIIGTTFLIPILTCINRVNLISILEIIAIWITLTILFFLIGKIFYLYKNKYNLAIISAHLFDGSSTFVAVDLYGFSEQHLIPNFIYKETLTAATIFPLKIIVITMVLYVVDKYVDDDVIKGLLKLSIFILGLAPGLRNLITLTLFLNI
ncbi:MAG: DUF63 family protein [Methanobrevibacter sp.]|jgi:uncharacterized membrane protein|nr:DUF63 family protein [Candidatus Methanovirga basalitermitum]